MSFIFIQGVFLPDGRLYLMTMDKKNQQWHPAILLNDKTLGHLVDCSGGKFLRTTLNHGLKNADSIVVES